MSENWTQGPWEVATLPLGSAIVSRQTPDGAPRVIANMELGTDGDTHLIAAAPELYEAVVNLLEVLADHNIESADARSAAHVLAKARGEDGGNKEADHGKG